MRKRTARVGPGGARRPCRGAEAVPQHKGRGAETDPQRQAHGAERGPGHATIRGARQAQTRRRLQGAGFSAQALARFRNSCS